MQPETTFVHSRFFETSIEKIYEAYTTPELLKQRRWPKWFTNEFVICDPTAGGARKYTMIWPNGAKHPNESIFVHVSKACIIIDHISKPHYVLTVNIQKEWDGTRMSRQQQFDTPEIYNQIKAFVSNANEENFDRLEKLLAT